MSATVFLPCEDCGRLTAIDGAGVWYDPGGPFAESDEEAEPSVKCAQCAAALVAHIEEMTPQWEEEDRARFEREEEWQRIARYAEENGA